MNIGLYISPSHAVPPDEKNILAPWMLVRELADGYIKNGHNVTLFAAKGSKTHAKLIHAGITPTIHTKPDHDDDGSYRSFVIAQELLLFREVITQAKAGNIDLIHVHQPVERLYPVLAALPPKFPVVITFHDPITPQRFPGLEKLYALGNVHFVSLSRAQQNGVPFKFAGVVPNGVDTRVFVPDPEGVPKNLLITGRIIVEKGFFDAITVARQTNERLMMVGEEYGDFFEKHIQPEIDKKTIFWEPVIKLDHLIGHYQKAKALLFPIHWEEPFGLVMIEAMACGTPVIAYDRGSVSEIVRDGVTGFVVDPRDGIDGLVKAVSKLDFINRVDCRKHVEDHFTVKAMIDGYEKMYMKISSFSS